MLGGSKVAMKLFSIIRIKTRAQDCFRFNCMENKRNLAKLIAVAKNFQLEAQKLVKDSDLRLKKW